MTGGQEAQIKKEGGQTAKLIREVEVKKSRGIHSNQNLSRAQLTLGRWRRRRRRRNRKNKSERKKGISLLWLSSTIFMPLLFSPLL